MELEKELEFYYYHKQKWLKRYKGQYALIKGEKLIGIFASQDEAFNEGINQLGNVPFLIQHIEEKEEVVQFPALVIGAISACS